MAAMDKLNTAVTGKARDLALFASTIDGRRKYVQGGVNNIDDPWDIREYGLDTATTAFATQMSFTVPRSDFLVGRVGLRMDLGVLDATTHTGGTYMKVCPMWDFIQKVRVSLGNDVVQLAEYDSAHIQAAQLYFTNMEDYDFYDASATPASDAACQVQCWLPTPFDQSPVPINLTDGLRIRVDLRALADSIDTDHTTLTAPTCTFSGVKLILWVQELHADDKAKYAKALSEGSIVFRYLYPRMQTFTVPLAGVTLTDYQLSTVTGACPFMLFHIRKASPTGKDLHTYRLITSFEIKDAARISMTGYTAILDKTDRYLLMPHWFKARGIMDTDYANLYAWSFASEPQRAVESAVSTGIKVLSGKELLTLTAPSAASDGQLDVLFYTFASLEILPGGALRTSI